MSARSIWFHRLRTSRPARCSLHFRPAVVRCEPRVLLNNQSFTWIGTSASTWETSGAWNIHPVGDAYPNADGLGTDTATLDGNDNNTCKMTHDEMVKALTLNL